MKKLELLKVDNTVCEEKSVRALAQDTGLAVNRVEIAVNELIDAHNKDVAEDVDATVIMVGEFKKSVDTAVRFRTALEAIAGSEDVGEFAPARAASAALSGYDVCLKANGKFHVYKDGDVNKQVDEAMKIDVTDKDRKDFAKIVKEE